MRQEMKRHDLRVIRYNDSNIQVSNTFQELYENRGENEVFNKQDINDYNQAVKDYFTDEGKDRKQSKMARIEELKSYFMKKNVFK